MSGNLKASITSISGDAEGAQYADDIAKVLRKAQIPVRGPNAAMIVGVLPKGLVLSVRDANSLAGKVGIKLHNAFDRAGIDIPGTLIPSMADDSIDILVGIKPHPVE